jgi:hypothetical protein
MLVNVLGICSDCPSDASLFNDVVDSVRRLALAMELAMRSRTRETAEYDKDKRQCVGPNAQEILIRFQQNLADGELADGNITVVTLLDIGSTAKLEDNGVNLTAITEGDEMIIFNLTSGVISVTPTMIPPPPSESPADSLTDVQTEPPTDAPTESPTEPATGSPMIALATTAPTILQFPTQHPTSSFPECLAISSARKSENCPDPSCCACSNTTCLNAVIANLISIGETLDDCEQERSFCSFDQCPTPSPSLPTQLPSSGPTAALVTAEPTQLPSAYQHFQIQFAIL